jgi:hypothetical protein
MNTDKNPVFNLNLKTPNGEPVLDIPEMIRSKFRR